MSERSHVPKKACPSCPYRLDHPSGAWSAHEYEKLRALDCVNGGDIVEFPNGQKHRVPNIGTFGCHQSNATGRDTICRGWLSVERESVGVKLLIMNGAITWDDVPEEDESDVFFSSGTEACESGLRDIENPGFAARMMVDSLEEKGIGRRDDDD